MGIKPVVINIKLMSTYQKFRVKTGFQPLLTII